MKIQRTNVHSKGLWRSIVAQQSKHTTTHIMKKLIALLVCAFTAAALAAATPNTHADIRTTEVGKEKVVSNTTSQLNIQVADFNAALFTTPVAVLVDVRPQAASTKVFAFSAAPVHWKVAYRAPIVEIGLICAASQPPTAPPGPDNPAVAAFVQNMARLAWHPPADDNPKTIKVAKGTGLT